MENAELEDLFTTRPSGISHLPYGLSWQEFGLHVSDFTVSFPTSFAFLIKAYISGRGQRTQMRIGVWQRVLQLTVCTLETTYGELAFKVESKGQRDRLHLKEWLSLLSTCKSVS